MNPRMYEFLDSMAGLLGFFSDERTCMLLTLKPNVGAHSGKRKGGKNRCK